MRSLGCSKIQSSAGAGLVPRRWSAAGKKSVSGLDLGWLGRSQHAEGRWTRGGIVGGRRQAEQGQGQHFVPSHAVTDDGKERRSQYCGAQLESPVVRNTAYGAVVYPDRG